jgi:hypothetical protein
VGGREGLQSLRVIEAIQKAARTGAQISVDIGIEGSRKAAVISNNKTAA